MPTKYRSWSITFHNISPNKTQDILKQYVQKSKKSSLSVEANPQGDGFHAHLFITYTSQRQFHTVLKELQLLSKKFIMPRPDDCKGDWGRVELDRMRGTYLQANSYLLGETKDKPIGELVQHERKPCFRRFRRKLQGTVSMSLRDIEEFCTLCNSANCPGCCPGCSECCPPTPEAQLHFEELRNHHRKEIKKLQAATLRVRRKKNLSV